MYTNSALKKSAVLICFRSGVYSCIQYKNKHERNIFQIIFRSNHKDKTLKTIILVMFLAGGVCRGNSVVKCYALYTHTCGDPQSCSASEKGQCRPPQQGAGVEFALERSSSRATKASGLRRAGRCPRS